MVYCVRCGAKNEDDAEACIACGAPLSHPSRSEPFGRGAGPRGRIEREGFGIPGGSSLGLAMGLIILLAGLSLLLKELYRIAIPWWPLTLMILGVFIIIGALLGSRGR